MHVACVVAEEKRIPCGKSKHLDIICMNYAAFEIVLRGIVLFPPSLFCDIFKYCSLHIHMQVGLRWMSYEDFNVLIHDLMRLYNVLAILDNFAYYVVIIVSF